MNALAPVALTVAAPSALVDRAALARAADIIALVVERRTTYPILANVRLRGDGKTLFLTGTDLDIVIDVAVSAAADTDFDTTISAAMLSNLVKGAPKASDTVSLVMPPLVRRTRQTGRFVKDESGADVVDPETNEPVPETEDYFEPDGDVSIDFGKANYSLPPLPTENWPTPFELRGTWTDENGNRFKVKSYRAFTMSGNELHAALDSVEFAISAEETRYYLNGIYMHLAAQSPAEAAEGAEPALRFVATDGHRLARQAVAAPEGSADMPGVILPKATVYLLQKLLKPAKGKSSPAVRIELTEKLIRFGIDDVTVTSKLVEGVFPDYERVTPKNNDKRANFSAAAMLEGIKAVSMIASERGGKAVKMLIDGRVCTLSVNNPDSGTATFNLEVETDFEGPFEIGFNSRYLAEVVTEAKADGDAITFALNDYGSPSLVTGPREGWCGVLMPLRV